MKSVSAKMLGLQIFLLGSMALGDGPAPFTCATDLLQPVVGTWQGSAVMTPPSGIHPQSSGTEDVFAIHGCNSFEVTVHYLDGSGNVTRILHFNAVPDSSGEMGLFDLMDGTITEGSSVSAMTGTLRSPQQGTLLGHFSGTVGGQPAYLSEVMTVTGNQLVRTVQMYAGHQDGAYIGTRVVRDTKVPAAP